MEWYILELWYIHLYTTIVSHDRYKQCINNKMVAVVVTTLCVCRYKRVCGCAWERRVRPYWAFSHGWREWWRGGSTSFVPINALRAQTYPLPPGPSVRRSFVSPLATAHPADRRLHHTAAISPFSPSGRLGISPHAIYIFSAYARSKRGGVHPVDRIIKFATAADWV